MFLLGLTNVNYINQCCLVINKNFTHLKTKKRVVFNECNKSILQLFNKSIFTALFISNMQLKLLKHFNGLHKDNSEI